MGLWITHIIYATGRQAVRLVVVSRGTALFGASLALLGGFVAVNVSAMFGPTAYARHFWLPFAMIGCLWTVRRRELDQSAAEARAAHVPTTAGSGTESGTLTDRRTRSRVANQIAALTA